MIRIDLYNVVSQVYDAPPEAHHLLNEILSYPAKGYIYSPRYKSGQWDGRTRLYFKPAPSREFGKLWSGNLYRAVTALASNGYEVEINDLRQKPQFGPEITLPKNFKARGFQDEAVAAMLKCSRGIVQAGTGAGKTILATMLIAKTNVPTLFFVQRIGLLRDAKKVFEKNLQVPVGIIQGSNRKLERINVATVQTLDSVLWNSSEPEIRDWCQNKCKMLLGDEVHHGISSSYKSVTQNFMDAYYRFGLSATPHRTEIGTDSTSDMQVESLFGRIIYEAPRDRLTKEDVLVPAHVFYLRTTPPKP